MGLEQTGPTPPLTSGARAQN
eukprot:SAG11_NODE_30172_length_303_cov_1.019608_1_plen_20_part_10